MKTNHIAKRALSLALCAVMLVSCWVFSAPTANAATSVTVNLQSITTGTSQPSLTNGKGQYRVRILVVEDGEHNKFLDGSNMDGTIHDNTTYKAGIKYVNSTTQSDAVAGRSITGSSDTGDYWCEWAQITYKNNNGTGTEGAVWFNLGDYDAGGRKDIISSGNQLCGYFPADDGLLINGFPTGVTCKYFENSSFSNSSFYFYLQVATWNGSSWSWTGDVGGNGTQGTSGSSCDSSHRCGIASNYTDNGRTSECWATSGGSKKVPVRSTGSILNSAYPKPTSTYTASSFAPAYSDTSAVTIPKTSSTSAVERTLSYTEPVDQYGVALTHTISVASSQTTNLAGTGGLSQSGKTTSVGFNQNIKGTTNSQTITATLNWPYINASGTSTNLSRSATLTVNDAKYTVTFKDEDDQIIKVNNSNTQSISYGCAATAPADRTKAPDDDYHYPWNGWDTAYNNITADTTVKSQGFTATAHNFNYAPLSDEDENVHQKHSATCSVCSYATTRAHNYGATTFTFAEDGNTCTASRQCSVSGCDHTQSQLLSLGSGITSEITTDETCTTVGTTTYTATSPFGDGTTGTKVVNDRPALGHDWSATSFSFAEDGKTATASRECGRNSAHNQSQAAVVTSAVLTPNTCTSVGTTRYTATSPFSGDSSTDYVDKNDLPAKGHNTTGEGWQTSAEQHWKNCINGCGEKQELANHDWNAWQDNGDGTHSRSCKVCGYVASNSHSGYNTVTTAPTCTTQGYTTYTCPTCSYSFRDDYTTALGHDASGSYESDGSNHWKVCATCGEDIYKNNSNVWTAGRIGHAWDEGEVTTQPTCTETGVLTKTCTVCGNDSNTSVVPAQGHNYTKDTRRDNETEKTPATCTTDGEYFYTCSRCDDISNSIYYTAAEGTTGYRLGHDYRQTTYTPKDSSPGFEYFKCSRCAMMRAADYNTSKDIYEIDESNPTEYSGANALDRLANDVINDDTNTSKVPSANFNDFTDPTIPQGDGGYSYADRGAGIRLMKTASGQPDTSFDNDPDSPTYLRTPQDMRFSGAASLPAGLDVAINPAYYNYTQAQLIAAGVDNAVVDFGFVYSQETYVYDHYTDGFADMTIENSAADAKLARMSVPAQNAAKGTFNKNTNNWDGVTYHVHNQGNESDNDQFTFNLVIQIRAKNWKYYYIGRPYMRYMYRGKLYTVYDNCASNGGEESGYPSSNLVYGLADEMVKYSDPLAWYAQAKIIDHNDDIPAGDIP